MSVRLVEAEASPYESLNTFIQVIRGQLEAVTNTDDLELLARTLRRRAKSDELDEKQRGAVNELRKAIYAKKRQIAGQEQPFPKTEESQEKKPMRPKIATPRDVDPPLTQVSFIDGVQHYFSRIDGEHFIRSVLKIAPLALGTMAVGGLFFLQSLTLYESSGFSQPDVAALGGLFMVLGFAAYHSVHRSLLAFLACIYIGGYEVYFVASGTVSNELESKQQDLEANNIYQWHQSNMQKAKADYEKEKLRFENPSSDVYQNSWFKKKFLDPKWAAYQEANVRYTQFLKDASGINFDHAGWLKILYRVGLLLLCMLLAHRLFSTPLTDQR